ncbi:Bzip transcription factor [Phytophthora megakarya]|uniref:Bzip transcription factor n=1 Tax=Phytophthora megakarya TaxID=4795 RepID=A0A225UR82_9STRA|nr:Bzip transcription factor [Phytophthora megakarya]
MKANYKTPARRLEQCRANQTRYRKKQKEYLLQLENNAENLRRELDDLRSRRQDIEAQAINEQSPWNVVADVFRLLDVSFRSPWCISNKEDANNRAKVKGVLAMIKNGFAQDVSMGDLTGVGALLDQVQRYSRFFGEPRIRLKKMEQEVPGVLLATSNLRLTITEYTLRCVFPYLETVSRSKYDTRPSVGARLIGQQLHCSCSMRFYFGDETGRVVKVDTSIDWITPLVQALGNLEEVSQVFDSALINSECLLGGHSKHSN